MRRIVIVLAVLVWIGALTALHATETENLGIRVVPALGKVVIDGKIDDWDLSGGIFAVNDVENLRDQYGVWFHAMYDENNLYVLARWNDPDPMNNPGSSKGDMGFQGDCLQVRFITDYGVKDSEKVSHWSCWIDRDKVGMMDAAYGRDFHGGNIRNAAEKGAAQAFSVLPDRKHYIQEISIPWALLTTDGKPLRAGDTMRMALEPNYTAGAMGRVTIKDIFQPGIAADRVFTFRAYPQWGTATLEKSGHVPPSPVRLSDGREFKTQLEADSTGTPKGGVPVVDWTGLIKSREPEGFIPIRFTMPSDGYISLNLYASDGSVARQLLNWAFYTKGEHAVGWDGLTTPVWRTPGSPVAPGTYTWRALTHPGIGLRLRGWACNGGSAPWDSGPTSNWGGDHGAPYACATDGDRVYLGWTGAEAGKALVACDLQGNVQWKQIRGGMGGAGMVGTDAGIVYVVDHDRTLYRLDAKTGGYSNWKDSPESDRAVSDFWDTPEGMPDRVEGMDAGQGKVYVTCSSASFRPNDAKNWASILGKVARREGFGATVFDRLNKYWKDKAALWGNGPDNLKEFCAAPNYYTPSFESDVIRILNAMLREEGPAANAAQLSGDARAQANRKAIEAALPGEFVPMQSNFLAVLDGATGKAQKRISIEMPRAVHAVREDLVYVVAKNGTEIVAVNPTRETVVPVVTGLKQARGVTVDAAGRILVSVAEPDQQVKIFAPDGHSAGAIGRPGGRPAVGPWMPEGMRQPAGLAVDREGKVWVTESTMSPKRVSVWNPETGALVKDYFGPTHYGASGGAINPRDPNVMAGEGCEWRIHPATGRAVCIGVFEDALHDAARYAEGSNGKLYLATAEGRGGDIEIRERVADGQYPLRAVIHPDRDNKRTEFWADANADAHRQPAEVTAYPAALGIDGWWFLNLNDDLSLYASGGTAGHLFRVKGFTTCAAPQYDLAGAATLPSLGSSALGTPDNRKVLSVDAAIFRCLDVSNGHALWTYPNTFPSVHGSHQAPPPEPGLTRGAFNIVGNALLPKPVGGIWVINGNCGEWYVFTEDGFFLTQLFQGDPFKQKFPDQAVPGAVLDECPPGLGGEDFGGSVQQGTDGKVYVQAGKTGLWNVEVVGLDAIRDIPGSKITFGAAEVEKAQLARESQLQAAIGAKVYTVKRGSATFAGNLDADFRGADSVRFEKQAGTGVKVAALRDATHLYVGWEVQDSTPWINGADAPESMYAHGDTVDLQLGTDPKADPRRGEAVRGDVRISIGNLKGTPTAVAYRKVAAEKHPKTFSSGVISEYVMDSVTILDGATIKVSVNAKGKRYVVEAAIPLSSLGVLAGDAVKLRGDFGVTHGDATGTDTALRTYWNNQQTGLVNDEVFELKMEPKNWGDIRLE